MEGERGESVRKQVKDRGREGKREEASERWRGREGKA